MKKLVYTLPLLLACLLTGCNGGTTSSQDISTSTSQTSESSKEEDLPTNYFEIEGAYVSEIFMPEQIMLTTTKSDNCNYFLLDSAGRIVYTAAYLASGYGTRGSSYQSAMYKDMIGDIFKSGKVIVPKGMMGYEINNQGYKKFMISVSNGQITEEMANDPLCDAIKEWNSKSNKYLNDNIGIKIKEGTSMETRNRQAFRLSSIYDSFDAAGKASYFMSAPYTDEYDISVDGTVRLEILNAEKKPLEKNSDGKYALEKGEIVYITVEGAAYEMFNFKVKPVQHEVELPYEVIKNPAISTYNTDGDSSSDPLKPAALQVKKRDDGRGLYVNCNNPEALYDDCLNTVLTGQDVTGKEVFFTYEHNNKMDQNFYYGYRVTNTGEEDIFITVKNLGSQVDGDGAWLGEDEWTQFYNVGFRTQGYERFTQSQMKNFDAYVGFSNRCNPEVRQPITFRVPKGKYIYVMGGTTLDAYKNINVFNSADRPVSSKISGCSNGAVLFEVSGGTAFGQFMAYSDRDAATINDSPYVKEHKQYGYVIKMQTADGEKDVGSQYAGYEPVHGVVDTNLAWEFNDNTDAGALPVSYTNPYYTAVSRGTPYSVIQNQSPKSFSNANLWVTHINPVSTPNAVGTDMTKYITTDHETGEDIVIEAERFDGKGQLANIGNWMVDYIDTLTLVNQGNKPREITYELSHNGVILAFVRDENGMIDNALYKPSYQTTVAKSTYGDAISEKFCLKVTVPAHSVKRVSIDYNLCANSSGYITHKVTIK